MSTLSELRAAAQSARPGDRISLAAGTYRGQVVLTRSGTRAAPIQLCGPPTAVIDPGDLQRGYGLQLDGVSWWAVTGLTVSGAQKGVVLDRSHDILMSGTHVHDVGAEGVHLRSATTDVVLTGLRVWATGRIHPRFGEGVYIGSAYRHWCEFSACGPDRVDRIRIAGSSFGPDVSAENIDVKEGSSDGVIEGNVFDGTGTAASSWVNIKGNSWRVLDNTGSHAPRDGVQVHVVVPGWGQDVIVKGNDMRVDAEGYGVRADADAVRVTVACDNVARGARSGLSNIECRRG